MHALKRRLLSILVDSGTIWNHVCGQEPAPDLTPVYLFSSKNEECDHEDKT